MAQLRSLGIERGKAFKPDRATRQLLDRAIAEAHAGFMQSAAAVQPFWPGSQWGLGVVVGPKTGFSFVTTDHLEIDERAMTFFLAYAAPKRLGAATFYVAAFRDAKGQQLRGDRSYRLHVPPDIPVKQYWAVTAYDLKTAAFIRESPQLGVDSYQAVQKNPDGSIDVYFGPSAPVGREANWVYTAFGKPWFTFFRFYGPDQALFEKRWRLGEIEPA
jgi:hypothetical protein